MHAKHLLTTTFIAILALIGCNKGSDTKSGPAPAVTGISADRRMNPGSGDRCPVCAMTTHDKKTVAAIALADGRTYYFCGPGCMIRTWLDPETHLGVDKGALKSAVATEFLTGEPIDAERAYWVFGSDVVGPMGPMPVPLESEAAVARFKERHGGRVVFQLQNMTLEKWLALKKPTPH